MDLQTQILTNNAFIIVWVLLCLTSWYFQYRLYKKVETTNPEKWKLIGEPKILKTYRYSLGEESLLKPLRDSWLTCKYIFNGDNELDSDKDLLRLRKINRIFLIVAFAMFVFYFFMALAFTFIFPPLGV